MTCRASIVESVFRVCYAVHGRYFIPADDDIRRKVDMIGQAEWITSAEDMGDVCPVFCKRWRLKGSVRESVLTLTALGVYDARLNGRRISDYILAPGWTSYDKRLQFQEYDFRR